jgi:hypothetical protein
MRRFNYISYITPADPKRQRSERYGKVRTKADAPQEIAVEFLAEIEDTVLQNIDGRIDSEDLSQNTFRFEFTFVEPYPGSVLVEMQEVEEGATHPLTKEGFIAWAEHRVESEPMVGGKSNSVELELAGFLHQRLVDGMHEEKARDLQAWLSDILWSGKQGYSEMSRDELLQHLQTDVIDDACESIETIEDALE